MLLATVELQYVEPTSLIHELEKKLRKKEMSNQDESHSSWEERLKLWWAAGRRIGSPWEERGWLQEGEPRDLLVCEPIRHGKREEGCGTHK
jgi:hypothetical protein